MSDNKSLCDTCLYKYNCGRSDAGISWANHSVCYGYTPVKNEKNGVEILSDLDALTEELLKDPEFRKEWKKLCDEEMQKGGCDNDERRSD